MAGDDPMQTMVNYMDLLRLFEVAASDPVARLRIAALDALAQMPVDDGAAIMIADVARHVLETVPRDFEDRRKGLAAAVRIPVLGLRARLRELARDETDPDAEWLHAELVRARDPAQIEVLLDEAQRGLARAYEALAGMPVEEVAPGPDALVEPEASDDEPDARLWWAIARARTGDYAPLDEFLLGKTDVPPLFWGDPWRPYETLAAMRPVPAPMHDHLVSILSQDWPDLDSGVERMRHLIVGALTGIEDAEGRPVDESAPTATESAPREAPSGEKVEAAILASGELQTMFDETGGTEGVVWLERAEASLDALGSLPADCAPPLVEAVVKAANDATAQLENGEPAEILVGNRVVDLISGLPASGDWPVAGILKVWRQAKRPALDRGQLAWVIARGGPRRVLSELEPLLERNLDVGDRLETLNLLSGVADCWAGRAGSPGRGAGPGASSRIEARSLIEGAPPPSGGFAGAIIPSPHDESRGGPAAEPPQRRQIRRNPHIDLSCEKPPPGTGFEVTVWADREGARPGEMSEPIEITAPIDIEHIAIEATLMVSSQLEIVGPQRGMLDIAVDRDSTERISFGVRVLPESEWPPGADAVEARVTVVFSHGARPSGMVSRAVPLGTTDTPSVSAREETGGVPQERLHVDPYALPADIMVHVKAHPDNDGRKYLCRVTSRKLPEDVDPGYVPWNLPGRADDIVRAYMARFVDPAIQPQGRVLELSGAGRRLFDAAPERFRQVYWALIDTGTPPETISIVSDEPYIPWELMKPHRRKAGRSESREPLGVECAVGRWIAPDAVAAPQHVALRDSLVIAPEYAAGRVLHTSEEEAAFVLECFPGKQVEPATLARIADAFGQGRAPSLVHFVCHGMADEPIQTVELQSGETLSATQLDELASETRYFEDGKTLVMLNACEVGRPAPALIGIEGFAKTFVSAGAAAVVASLWSVKDSVAHDVAREFYEAVRADPERPYADIVRGIRQRAYDMDEGEDTYAAYCFYGDPMASGAA